MTAREDSAARLIADMAGRLADPERVVARLTEPRNARILPDGTQAQWSAITLTGGYPAMALLFAELGGDDRRHRLTAQRYLRLAVDALDGSEDAGLFTGTTSVAFAAAAAARRPGDYERALAALDERIGTQVRSVLDQESARLEAGQPGTAFAAYDVISGLTGVGRYLLARGKPGRALLAEVLRYLIALTRPVRMDGVELPGWWVQHGTFVLDPVEWARGHVNFGLAHGIPGPLALLALAWQEGMRMPGHEEAIHLIAGWLLDWASSDDSGPNWPGSLQKEEVIRRPDPLRSARTAWCYGAPGVARALQMAGQALRQPGWTQAALWATRAFLDRSRACHDLSDAWLCHGWAGLLHVTWRIGQDAGDADILGETHRLAEQVMSWHDPEAPFGFPAAAPGNAQAIDLAGFLEGAAGVALALHVYATGEAPASGWDAALLVA